MIPWSPDYPVISDDRLIPDLQPISWYLDDPVIFGWTRDLSTFSWSVDDPVISGRSRDLWIITWPLDDPVISGNPVISGWTPDLSMFLWCLDNFMILIGWLLIVIHELWSLNRLEGQIVKLKGLLIKVCWVAWKSFSLTCRILEELRNRISEITHMRII
jgi:hypothetical protein